MITLQGARDELWAIIQELWSIEHGIRHEFEGIGQQMCADCVLRVADYYRMVFDKLNSVNTNLITDIIATRIRRGR